MWKPTALQRLRELFGKYLGLFGEIFSAGPVVFSCRSLGFIEERIHFGSQIGLGGVQAMSLGSCQVAFRDTYAFVHLLLGCCYLGLGELRREQRFFRLGYNARLGWSPYNDLWLWRRF